MMLISFSNLNVHYFKKIALYIIWTSVVPQPLRLKMEHSSMSFALLGEDWSVVLQTELIPGL